MWHYTIDNNPQDPIDEATIAQLIANGTIHANTLVWQEGMADWIALGSTELASYVPSQPAGPVRRPAGQVPRAVAPVQSRQLATNPYSPPQAAPRAVQRVTAANLSWKQILWSFQGRIPRRTYWAGIGIWVGILMGLSIMIGVLTPVVGEEKAGFLAIPFLLVLIPYMWSIIAMQVKRWHDRDKSGAMVLVNFIPIVGGIWAFVECGCLRGSNGANKYGEDPT